MEMDIKVGSYVINRFNITSITQPISAGKDLVDYEGVVGHVLAIDETSESNCFVKYGDIWIWEKSDDLIPVLSEGE